MCVWGGECVCVCIKKVRMYGQSVRHWPERQRFNSRSSHTKDSKNGT